MNNLAVTIIIAFVLILAALIILGIGWLITGKNKIKGSCGGVSKKLGTKNDKESCENQTGCGLCGKNEEKENIDENNH